jgi:anaerobic ribonucleoside-triphosphate reductase activating protein
MTVDEIVAEIEKHGFNVTFSGGDPLYQLPAITELARALRQRDYTIWCYTGFLYDDICDRAEVQEFLTNVEVLVDGPFKQELRDISLLFRGSSNQRLIDIRRTTPGDIHLWSSPF